MGVDKVGLDCKLNLFPFDVLFPSASEPSFNFDNSKMACWYIYCPRVFSFDDFEYCLNLKCFIFW